MAAVCALVRRGDRVLALRRSPAKDAAPGIWEALSGRVEPDESPFEAVRREIREESGLEVTVDPRPLSAHTARRLDRPMLIVYYRADWVSGEVVLSDEHDDHAWLPAGEFARRTPIPELACAVEALLSGS